MMSSSEDEGLQIVFSVLIAESLAVSVFIKHVKIRVAEFQDFIHDGKLRSSHDLVNLLAAIKSRAASFHTDPCNLEHFLKKIEDFEGYENPEQELKVAFALEQLNLALKPKMGRRYSPDMLSCALQWMKTSPALYRQLLDEGLLTLPSVNHLQKISTALNVETGELSESTLNYLRLRIKKLNDWERNCILIVDEIYSAQRVEYSNGRFFGQKNGEPTKTMLGLMIKSVAGKYSDMIALVPQTKLNSEVLKSEFDKVFEATTVVGFHMVATLADNHRINRKFFQHELGSGSLSVSIPHPTLKDEKHFLIFDPVHIFKNFFNNFVNRGVLSCPPFRGEEVGTASFQHLRELYSMECTKPLKFAHKLREKVLFPKPIERSSVQLAESLFHSSTVDATEFYLKDKPQWQGTYNFLKIINTWWSIVNVKNPTKGLNKRNENMWAVTATHNHQLQFLHDFSEWIESWDGAKERSITKDTAQAAAHTTRALIEVAEHMIFKKNF